MEILARLNLTNLTINLACRDWIQHSWVSLVQQNWLINCAAFIYSVHLILIGYRLWHFIQNWTRISENATEGTRFSTTFNSVHKLNISDIFLDNKLCGDVDINKQVQSLFATTKILLDVCTLSFTSEVAFIPLTLYVFLWCGSMEYR